MQSTKYAAQLDEDVPIKAGLPMVERDYTINTRVPESGESTS